MNVRINEAAQTVKTITVEDPIARCDWANWSDEELLMEYRYTGIRESVDEIVRRYEQDLYAYLCHYLGHASNAEDAFQKTFLAVVQNCGKFDASRKLRPWIYRIAANIAVEILRKAKKCSAISIDAPIKSGDNDETMAGLLTGDEPEPFEDPMDREVASKVREAVDSLPDKIRQAVYMVYFQGLPLKEAAKVAGVHYSILTSRLKTAYGKLNYLLKNVG